jgi:uncharacterized protein (DUF952 family)
MTVPFYHITSKQAWEQASQAGTYTADTLKTQGFIHCSTAGQVLRVANALYHGSTDLVLLEIDSTHLGSEVRWEPGADKPDELFPHLYGALEPEAVTRVLAFLPEADGSFRSLPG